MGTSLIHKADSGKTKNVIVQRKQFGKEVAESRATLIPVKYDLINILSDRKTDENIRIIETFTKTKIDLINQEIKKTGSFAIPYENVTNDAIAGLGQEFDIEPNGDRLVFILRSKP